MPWNQKIYKIILLFFEVDNAERSSKSGNRLAKCNNRMMYSHKDQRFLKTEQYR